MESLYIKLGGQEAVDAVVETFYRKVLVDDRICKFFENTDMEEQIAKQTSFLSMVLGGPTHFKGKNMRDAHAPMVQNGLNDTHVDAVIELLGSSLLDHGVSQEDVAAVAKIANSVRSDVLNR
jgi:hemoglobin